MNISLIILTYNRPKVSNLCIQTLFGNTKLNFNNITIIDDGSDLEYRQSLFDFCSQNSFDFISHGQNKGIGYSFENAYSIMRNDEENDIVCFIESDYIWRKGWLEDVVAIFESSKDTVAIAGTDHPDMYDRTKTHNEFCKLMIEQFGKDLSQRENLYKPFLLNTSSRGEILVQGVSNSCGCQFIHWKRLKKMLKSLSSNGLNIDYEKEYWRYMDRAFHKNNSGNRRFASDAHMSGTISMFAEEYIKLNNTMTDKNFGFLSICDYSISEHYCGGGINGMIVPEGSTFVHSPKWNNEYINKDPREK